MKIRMPRRFLILTVITLSYILGTGNVNAEDLIISDNGSDSQNNVSISQENNTQVQQQSTADIQNDTQTTADTGGNEASGNSGDTTINTGDVQASEIINNEANQSVVDSPCCPTSTTATISGNGADSQNNIEINRDNSTNINVNQEANISNQSQGTLISGNNTASNNIGNTTIETGNISASLETFNQGINMSRVEVAQGSGGEVSLKVSGNGTGSNNSITFSDTQETNIEIDNRIDLDNVIDWEAITGNNFAQGNLGDVFIRTGDADLEIIIENGPINSSEVILRCCEEAVITPPVTPPVQPPVGGGPGEQPPAQQPPSVSQPSPAGQPGPSDQGAAGEVLAAVGDILPISGNNWIVIITLISGLLFFLGLFLRLHPGRDPGVVKSLQ